MVEIFIIFFNANIILLTLGYLLIKSIKEEIRNRKNEY
jgi:hypothetical protein